MSRPPRIPKPDATLMIFPWPCSTIGLETGAGAEEGACEVHVHDAVPVIVGYVPDGLTDVVLHRPSVVNQHVNLAEARDGGVHQRVNLRRVGDVGGDGDGFAAQGLHFSNGVLDGPGPAARYGQGSPGAGQGANHRQPQARAASGNHYRSAVKTQ